jgi:hypothetical protein
LRAETGDERARHGRDDGPPRRICIAARVGGGRKSDLVFNFADRISVLVAGRMLTEGAPKAIAADERVRAVYLGEDVHG